MHRAREEIAEFGVPLMDGGAMNGSGGRPAVPGHDVIAQTVNGRVMAPSVLRGFFIHTLEASNWQAHESEPLMDLKAIDREFFQGRTGGQRKALNIAVALFEVGRLPCREIARLVPDLLRDIAGASIAGVASSVEGKTCTDGEVRAVEVELSSMLESRRAAPTLTIQRRESAGGQARVRGAFQHAKKIDRRQILSTSDPKSPLVMIASLVDELGLMAKMVSTSFILADNAPPLLVDNMYGRLAGSRSIRRGDIWAFYYLNTEVTSGNNPLPSLLSRFEENGMGLAKRWNVKTDGWLEDGGGVGLALDEEQLGGAVALQCMANLLDELPGIMVALFFSFGNLGPERGAMLIQMMRPKKAAELLSALKKSKSPEIQRMVVDYAALMTEANAAAINEAYRT